MAENIKTLTKNYRTRNIGNFHYFVLYIPMLVTLTACFIVAMVSIRLSYVNNESMRDLQEEVIRLQTILEDSWLSDILEFDPETYHNYYLDSGAKIILTPINDRSTITFDDSNESNDIGVMKYATEDDQSISHESELRKTILQEVVKRRFPRSAWPALNANLMLNDPIELEEGLDTTPSLQESLVDDKLEPKNPKFFMKRSPIGDQLKSQLGSSKLVKPSLHDSVEEFPIGTEPTTAKTDISSKRTKHRSRHNIETLDERTISGKKKIMPAIHFDGDSSGYVVGKHTNYNGNGHLSHPSQIYSDWAQANWVKSMAMDEYFQLDKGLVKIKEHGLYLIYVQIYYLDDHDTNGYRVYKNDDALLQCTTMTHSAERLFKGNTCYTSRVEFLKENDVISIRDLANGRYTIFEEGKSFFGLVKLK